MSARQRADAELLRSRYASAFRVPKEDVVIEYGENEDAAVFHKSDTKLPRWSLGVREPAALHGTLREWRNGGKRHR